MKTIAVYCKAGEDCLLTGSGVCKETTEGGVKTCQPDSSCSQTCEPYEFCSAAESCTEGNNNPISSLIAVLM